MIAKLVKMKKKKYDSLIHNKNGFITKWMLLNKSFLTNIKVREKMRLIEIVTQFVDRKWMKIIYSFPNISPYH